MIGDQVKQQLQSENKGTDDNNIGYGAAMCHTNYKQATWVGVSIGFFMQFSGLTPAMIYSVVLFESTGAIDPFIATLYLCSMDLLGTVLVIFLIKKFGRKTLLITGHFLAALGLGASACATVYKNTILMFVGVGVTAVAFEVSSGPLIYVVLTETCSDTGLSLGIFSLWISMVIMSLLTPILIAATGAVGTYVFFAAFGLASCIFWAIFMKETFGLSPA